MNRLKQALLLLVLAAGSSLALIAVAEWGLRTLAPIHLAGMQNAYEYDEDLGYRVSPGTHIFRLTDHLQEIRTNRLGTVNFQESFEGYEELVFAAGDSFTQGTGLPADASYPFQLGLLLNRDESGLYERRLGIVNLGLAAFGGRQSLISLERYGNELGKPAYVLYLGSDNDWEDDVLFENGYRHRHIVRGSPKWGIWVKPLLWLGDLELVKRSKVALAELRLSRLVDAEANNEDKVEDERAASVAEREWPVIEEIHHLTQGWDATLILSWANAPGPSYSWLRERAAKEGIAFADWEARVASIQREIPQLPVANPHSGGHWRTWVNGQIAQSFSAEIRLHQERNEGRPARGR